MKFNWGTGIFIFYTAFVVFILALVFRTSQENIDLVTDDYYLQELEYQDIIQKKSNASKLDSGLTYSINKMNVAFNFPPSQMDINGDIKIYRASNKNFDKVFEIDLNNQNQMIVSMDNSPLGLYKMMVTWESDSIGFYVEEDIYLKP